MLWAVACVCFFGFFRLGEITVPSDAAYDATSHTSIGDLAVDSHKNPKVIRIHLKKSKTDQLKKGADIFIGKTGNDLCPVSAMLAYVAIRGFREGPLFRFVDGRPLTKDRFIHHLRSALTGVGIDSSLYSGHSFRIGAATTAAEKGVEDSTIRALGRWKSDAYLGYIRTPRETLAQVSQTLAK